jgi:hypothetical protein
MLGSEIEDDFKAGVWNTASAWYNMPSTTFLAARTPGQGDKNEPLAAVDIKDEPISTRGWTLQESWLSSRMLIESSMVPHNYFGYVLNKSKLTEESKGQIPM